MLEAYSGKKAGTSLMNRAVVSTQENKIIDIDLDYFASDEFNPAHEDFDIQLMRENIAGARVATLATSPGFIDPDRAVAVIRKILS